MPSMFRRLQELVDKLLLAFLEIITNCMHSVLTYLHLLQRQARSNGGHSRAVPPPKFFPYKFCCAQKNLF